MIKVLTGEGYTMARLAGILHECYVNYLQALPKPQNATIYLDGLIKENLITGAVGAIFCSDSLCLECLPQIHIERLIDVVEGDGWLEEEGE